MRGETMSKFLWLLWFLKMCIIAEGGESVEVVENLITDIIRTWTLLSPTIVTEGGRDVPDLCKGHHMTLCVMNDDDTTDLAEHLELVHKSGNQA